MSDDFQLLNDAEIAAQIRAGMVPQATLRVQARQMKALDRIAEELTKLAVLMEVIYAHPSHGESWERPGNGLSQTQSAVQLRAMEAEDLVARAVHDPALDESGLDPEGAFPVGPATDLTDAGTPRARRRRAV